MLLAELDLSFLVGEGGLLGAAWAFRCAAWDGRVTVVDWTFFLVGEGGRVEVVEEVFTWPFLCAA